MYILHELDEVPLTLRYHCYVDMSFVGGLDHVKQSLFTSAARNLGVSVAL